ncbi:MAG: histone deacetylase [Desulfobacterales bacterium]|nr:histone deacetylase [Desulfobacterales bacterium]
MKIFYTDTFKIPLPEKHSFPKDKYYLLRKRIENAGIVPPESMIVPEPASEAEILRVHDPVYWNRLKNGELSDKEIRRVGLPWSPEIVRRARYSTGATIAACRTALTEKIAVNLGGGTHHAFSGHGQGYCWINDSVIASRVLQTEALAYNILIVDCDVHQGNGTAALVRNDPTIFTFSIHGKNNFPFRKEISDLDIELDDGTDDASYLEALRSGLETSLQNFSADLAIYLAGADAHKNDRFGRLALSKAGLARRDHLVLEHLHRAGLPVAVTMAGGYSPQVSVTVDIHFQTVLAAVRLFQ